MQVLLLRHGLTEWNLQRRYQGRTDLPLAPGEAARLRPLPFAPEVVYVSPLRRARQTAGLLLPGAEYRPVPGLEEMDFGVFEGKTYQELCADEAYRAWCASGGEGPVPGGEDKASFCARVTAAFAPLVGEALQAGRPLLAVVAHGGTQMAVLERYAVPHRPYYEWNAKPGEGFLLRTSPQLWAQHTLLLQGEVRGQEEGVCTMR